MFLFVMPLIARPTSAATTWAYDSWQYRTAVTISNPNSYDLTDFQVKVVLDSSWPGWDNVKQDGGDIRFAADDGTIIPYWIEQWDYTNQQAVIWVKVPLIPAGGSTAIYIYYGNSGAVSESDGNAVFDFFDDFNTDKLYVNIGPGSGTYSISDSVLYMQHQGGAGGFDYTLKIGDFDLSMYQAGSLWVEMKFKTDTQAEIHGILFRSAGTEPYNIYKVYGTQNVYAPAGIYYADVIYSGSGDWEIVGARIDDFTDGTIVAIAIDYDAGSGKHHWVDWIRIRKYADQEPTVTVGTTEEVSTITTYTITLELKDNDGAPLSGVAIYLNNVYQGIFSDGDTLSVTSTGTYTIRAEKEHYIPGETTVDVIDSATPTSASLTLTLVPTPTLTYSPATVHVGDTITMTASATEVAGYTWTYYYRVEDITAGVVLQDWSTVNTYTITSAEAHHTLRLWAKTCEDNYGVCSAETYVDVIVENTPPTPPTDITADKSILSTTDTVTFSASGSTDVDGDTISYEYKFVDVDTGTVLKDWSTAGSFYIDTSLYQHTLRVYARAYDGHAYSLEFYKDFVITNSPPSAPTDISIYPGAFRINTQTSITASGSTDAEGDTIIYEYKIVDATTGTVLQDWSTTNTYTITNIKLMHHTITIYARAFDGYAYSAEYSESFFVMPAQTIDLIPFDMNSVQAMSVHNLTDIPDMTIVREKLALNAEDMALFDVYNMRDGSTIYIYVKFTSTNITFYYTHPLAPFLAPHDSRYDTADTFVYQESAKLLNFLKSVNALPPTASATATVYSSEANCAGSYVHIYYKGVLTSEVWDGSFLVNAAINATSPSTLLQYYISIPSGTTSYNAFYLNWYDLVDETSSTNREINFYTRDMLSPAYKEDTIYPYNVGTFDSFKQNNQFGFYMYAYEDTIYRMAVRMRLIVVDNTNVPSTTAMAHVAYQILPLPLPRIVTFKFYDDLGNILNNVTVITNGAVLGTFDTNGTYTFDEICTITLTASKEHYISDTKDVYLATTTTVSFTLDRESYVVYVYAYDKDNNIINQFNLGVDGVYMGVFNSGQNLTVKYGIHTFTFEKEGYLTMEVTKLIDTDGIEIVFSISAIKEVMIYVYDAKTNVELTDVNLTYGNTVTTINSGEAIYLQPGNYTFTFFKEGYSKTTLNLEIAVDLVLGVYLAPLDSSSNITKLTALENPVVPPELAGYAPNVTDLNTNISELFTGAMGWALAVIFILGLVIASIKFHQKPAVTAAAAGASIVYLGTWVNANWSILWVLIAMLFSASILRMFGRYQK